MPEPGGVRIVVTGSIRIRSEDLAHRIGQPVVVENHNVAMVPQYGRAAATQSA